jgi:amidohydrolase
MKGNHGMATGKIPFKEWLVNLRNDLHQHPELSGREIRTTQKIAEILETLRVETRTFDDLTGLVGLIKGGLRNGSTQKTIAIRADIDALPLRELSSNAFQSIHEGVMHACGHDANTAILLGVAKKIMESGLKDRINGFVKLIFQPAEEKLNGAKAMLEKGVLENPKVDRLIAGHMDPNLPVGAVGVFHRVGHAASDPFELVITGKGSHGARPHKGINPITAGGIFVSSLDSIIPRNIPAGQSAVVSAGTFHAGNAGNVIPEQAVIRGTVRTHDPEIRSTIFKAMERLANGIEAMTGAKCELAFKPGAPLGLNDEATSRLLQEASESVVGKEKVKVLPFIMGSDDFYFFSPHCPSAMIRLGCTPLDGSLNHPLHSPYFDIHEDVLEIGVNVFFKAVEIFFKNPK